MPRLPEDCPICGGRMEHGYITANSPALFWSIERSKRSTWSADVIAGGRVGLRNANLEAYRCQNCKIAVLSYENEGE